MLQTLENMIIFLFDVDGVIAETPHEEAWKAAAVKWGIIPASYDFTQFYAAHVAGEPGVAGALNILAQLHEENKQTYYEKENVTNPSEKEKVAEKFRDPVKQRYLDEFIANEQFRVFEDTAKIIFRAKSEGIPIGAVSSSENAEAILKKINAVNLASKLGLSYKPASDDPSFYSVFETTTLGVKSYWHNAKIQKLHHYALARGMLLEASRRKGFNSIPYAIVFEDAPKGIAAISPYDFCCIGISRKSTSGVQLASKQDLFAAGAKLAYTEAELKNIGYAQLRPAIIGIIPVDVK